MVEEKRGVGSIGEEMILMLKGGYESMLQRQQLDIGNRDECLQEVWRNLKELGAQI